MNYRRAQSRVAEVVENAPLERPDHVERPAAAPAEQVVPADPEPLPRFRKNKGGHTRKDWKQIATEKISDESLRDASKRWLKEKQVVHHPLSTSSRNKTASLLAKCAACAVCTKQYSFRLQGDDELLVEQVGECSEKKDRRSGFVWREHN